MQTLWARAAKRCTCNCILCHSSATALNRRATTAALKRRVRFRDIFTLFYSSFLVSATIANIGRKEAKKVEWENRIKEARDELKALQDQQQERLAAVSWPDGVAAEKIHLRPNDWSGLFQWATEERKERKSLGFQELRGVPTSLLKGLSAPEVEELMLDRYIARLNSADRRHLWNTTDGNRPLSVKKVKTLEWSVRKLVHRLILSLLETSERNSEQQSDQASTDCQLGTFAGVKSDLLRMKIDRCDRRLDFLYRHSSNTEYWYRFMSPNRPTYSRRSRDDLAWANSLNPKLRRIFKYATCDTRKDAWLTQVCSVLLFSYVPPDIHTYNLLIINLLKLNQMDDVEAVIQSMHESHVRPNEVTLSTMLGFYNINDDRRGFLSLLRKIDGQDGGLSCAHAATEISPMFSGRYNVSEKIPLTPVRISEEEEDYYYEMKGYNFQHPEYQPRAQCHSTRKVVQSANMNILDKAVYGAMIHGALKFLGPEKAMEYYSRMVSDGWEAGIRELGQILQYQLEKSEWQAGLAVWQEICKLPEGANRAAFECMLLLCRKCQKHILFGQVLDYGVRQKLISRTDWQFTNKICGGNVVSLLRSEDSISSVTLSASPITIARDSLERSFEALGYRIASTALDLADTALDAPYPIDSNTALKMYFTIRRLHRKFPDSSGYRARKRALQGLVKKARKDKQKQGKPIQGVCPEDMNSNSSKTHLLESNRVTPSLTEQAHTKKHKRSQFLGTHGPREHPQTSQTIISEPQSASQLSSLVAGDLKSQAPKTMNIPLSHTKKQSTKQPVTKYGAVKADQHMTKGSSRNPSSPPRHPIQHTHQLDQSPSAKQTFDPRTSLATGTPQQSRSQPTIINRGRKKKSLITLKRVSDDDASQQSKGKQSAATAPSTKLSPSRKAQSRRARRRSAVPRMPYVDPLSSEGRYRFVLWPP